ncbi:hypothetical protein AAL_07919 [Moelleriella libera RCEF 2490]|uniref:Uncharacterized protein n=1 Tax=Moelleriella libera RCEF 2490 TaxID=1081109 RepID=A0A167WKN8_9HYPO|nr:hypothetical protein AAL_07919 [Moelleriella libera RCEF 2490]
MHNKNVDTIFEMYSPDGKATTLVIGEFKRHAIRMIQWQNSAFVSSSQGLLSRELRAYASIYKCPQIFCCDKDCLLLL